MSDLVPARFCFHRGITEGKLGLRSDLPCASPRGRLAADREPGRGWSVSASGSGVGGCFPPLFTSPMARSSEGGGQCAQCSPRQVQQRPAALCLCRSVLGPHGSCHRSGRRECPHLPCSPGARRAGGGRAAAAGRGASGLPSPAPVAAGVWSPSPCRWCAQSSALRWEPPTEVSVPRATGAAERADTPRSPGRAAGQLRLPGCAPRSPLKEGLEDPLRACVMSGLFPTLWDARGHP